LLVIRALLKQLSEKLDVVRESAGKVLEELLFSPEVRIPGIPERPALEAALQGAVGAEDGGSKINWSSPNVTFPIIVKAMSLEAYHEVGKRHECQPML